MKKALFPPLPLLYTSDGEMSEEDLAEYSSLIRPYQDELLAGEDTMENDLTQMGSLQESCRTDTKEPRHHSVIITCGRGFHCVLRALCVFVLLSVRDPYKIAGLLSVELLSTFGTDPCFRRVRGVLSAASSPKDILRWKQVCTKFAEQRAEHSDGSKLAR